MKKLIRTSALVLSLLVVGCAGVLFTARNLSFGREDIACEAVTEAAVLRQGSTGSEVKTVQSKLKRWGYYSGAVDGVISIRRSSESNSRDRSGK